MASYCVGSPIDSRGRRPTWAPAASQMAFTTDRSGNDEIWLRSQNGEFERPLVTSQDFARSLRDGSEVAEIVPAAGALTQDALMRVSIIRNATEHLDSRIRDGLLEENDLQALWMDEDFVELEDARIQYSELGNWLVQLHEFAERLCQFEPKSAA